MSKLVIEGGARLNGEVSIEGSKNAVLPILAASLLNGGESIIKNCPRLRDVEVMLAILKKIGCSTKMEGDVITINSSDIKETQIPVDLAAEMRSSIIFMGPMLARCGKVTISYPGGCVTLWVPESLLQMPLSNFMRGALHSFACHFVLHPPTGTNWLFK